MGQTISNKRVKPRKDSSKYIAVLQATRELVDEKGYRALSLKAIASSAGVSRNVLYNWWDGDLQEIVEEAILPNVIDWLVPDTGSLKGDLTVFVEMTLESLNKPHALAAFLELQSQAADKPENLQRTIKKFRKPYAKILGRILQNAVKRGEIPKREPEAQIHHSVMAQMISGSAIQFAISKNPGRRKSKTVLVESVLKLVM